VWIEVHTHGYIHYNNAEKLREAQGAAWGFGASMEKVSTVEALIQQGGRQCISVSGRSVSYALIQSLRFYSPALMQLVLFYGRTTNRVFALDSSMCPCFVTLMA